MERIFILGVHVLCVCVHDCAVFAFFSSYQVQQPHGMIGVGRRLLHVVHSVAQTLHGFRV